MILPNTDDYVDFCTLFTKDNYTRLVHSEEAGYDFITPPCPRPLLSRRIYNAIRAQDSYGVRPRMRKRTA